MKHLLFALVFLVLGTISGAHELAAFYPLGDLGIFKAGSKPQFALHLSGDKSLASGKLLVKDQAGATVQELPWQLSGGATHEISLEVPKRHGFYTVQALLGEQELEASFISIPLMPKRDPFFAVKPGDWAMPEMFLAYKTLGFGAISLVAGFNAFTDGYNPDLLRQEILSSPYFTRIDKLLETHPDFEYYGHVGLDTFLLSDNHRRKIPDIIMERQKNGFYCYPKEYYEAFTIYLEAFHKIAGHRVKHWALVQEIDAAINDVNRVSGGGPVELAHHLINAKIAYNCLKNLDPHCVVSLTSSCGNDYFRNQPPFSLTRFILQHLEGKFDMLGLDAYNGNYSLRGGREKLDPPEQGLRKYLIDTKILCREFGKQGEICIDERQTIMPEPEKKTPFNGNVANMVADMTARETIIIKSVKDIAYYAYLDYGFKSDMVFWKHLYDQRQQSKRSPYPAALAFATTARSLSFCRPARRAEMIMPYGVYAYLFNKGDESVVPLWTVMENKVELELELPAGSLLRDISGNDSTLSAGKTTLSLSSTPLFLLLPIKAEAARAIIQNGRFVNEIQPIIGEARLAAADKTQLYLRNQSGLRQVVLCEGQSFILEAEEHGVFELDGIPKAKQVTIEVGGKHYVLPATLEALGLPHRSKGTKKILLSSPEDVFPRSASIPERNLILNDGKDIEAELELAWDEDCLHLQAKVRDRRHLNSNQGAFLWRGDSMQIGMAAGNQAWDAELSGNPKAPFNISLALTDNGVFIYDYTSSKNLDWDCQVTRSGFYTHYKLAIPWSAIKKGEVRAGEALAMSIVFFDLNKPGEKVQHWLSLGQGLAGKANPGQFESFVLE